MASEGVAAAIPTIEASVAMQLPAELGEGSIWDVRSRRLLWLDIVNAKLYRFDPETGENEEHDLSGHSKAVSSVVPLASEEDPTGNKLGLTLREGFALYDCDKRALTVLQGNPEVAENERFNDGKVDPAGRYWAGTFARDAAGEPIPQAALYRRNANGSIERILAPVTISNGIIWTKDACTMYYTDTPEARIDALDYDNASGVVKNRRPCITGFDFETTGFPDGCTLDCEGMLWVARFNGGCAGRYNPSTGQLLAEVHVPATAGKQVTSVAFGGDDLGDLYLTTAHEGQTAEEASAVGKPLAGCLFRVTRAELAKIGAVPGQPAHMLRCAL
eukprot:CAMPEP_0171095440 /NCGR_PEP_ID=MMETSP0766_2-20121228/43174_1 /TAXON_ID=439317 /ORGANISM="Gambierdiscus australes, Strain CAWD 149" /LENGTH=330 /DNA_ID=CAMNT_0011554247 /DNA_START=54 /DNA_END=1046 /DNA_ORIENTATION=+